MPTFITLLILAIGSFLSNGFDQYYMFQNAFNKDRIEVLDLYVYNKGIVNQNISYTTAVGMLKSLVGLVLLFVSNTLSGKFRENKIFWQMDRRKLQWKKQNDLWEQKGR